MLASSPSPAKASKWATIATTVKNHDMAGSIFGAAPIIATSAPSFKHAAKASKGGRNSDQAINGGKLPLLTDAARWHHDDNNTRDEKKSILNKFGKQVEKYKTKFEDPEWIRKEKSQGEILQALSPPTENLVEEKDMLCRYGGCLLVFFAENLSRLWCTLPQRLFQ